jgi:hypothetical protein
MPSVAHFASQLCVPVPERLSDLVVVSERHNALDYQTIELYRPRRR